MTTNTETIEQADKTFLPAAGHDWLLPFYDPLVKLLGGDKAKKILLNLAAIEPGHRVLDIGCGTGTLALLIKRNYPKVDVVGIDPDSRALARAERKMQKAGVNAKLDQGFADRLPYPDHSFDRVFSSFMFHHLPEKEKEGMLQEVRRVLKPGGSLHLLDFKTPAPDQHGRFSRWIHSSHVLKDNSQSRVLSFLKQTGFQDPTVLQEGSLFFWKISYYRAAVAPAHAASAAP